MSSRWSRLPSALDGVCGCAGEVVEVPQGEEERISVCWEAEGRVASSASTWRCGRRAPHERAEPDEQQIAEAAAPVVFRVGVNTTLGLHLSCTCNRR